MKSYVLIFSLLILCACSSTKKLAQKLSDQGLHEEAVTYWEKALEEDSDDDEALVGIKISQTAVVNERLVKVRDLRVSKDLQAALGNLKALVELQQKWKMKSDYNSSAFQGQETLALWKYFDGELNVLVQKKRALAAAATLEEYRPVFSYLRTNELNQHALNIQKVGKAACSTMFKTINGAPYYESFVRQYCHYFGSTPKNLKELKLNELLVARIKPVLTIQGLPEGLQSTLSSSLQQSLEKTPWFSNQGQKELQLNVDGFFKSDLSSKEVSLSHSYEEQEPYTAYENVQKEVTKTGVNKELVCKTTESGHQLCEHVDKPYTYTDYKTVKEAVTRYRSVTKIFDYTGTEKFQRFNFSTTGKFQIEGKSYNFNLAKEEQEKVLVHNQNLPDIGLKPSGKDVTPVTEKFKVYASELAEKFHQRSIEIWSHHYCVLPSKRTVGRIADHVLRCRKIYSDENKHFVEHWFHTNHGVTSLVAEKTIGSF